jgi:serine/threonine protein kinase
MLEHLTGQVINSRYEIGQQIAAGGIGAIYGARDLLLKRDVAVKVVLPENLWSAYDAPEIFLEEARMVAALDHENILTIYDVIHQSNPHYPILLVTELAKGGSLYSRIHPPHAAPNPVSTIEAESILTQIAAALDYAHSQKIIHLDIKPSNILFAEESGRKVLLADFGLAKLLQTATHVPVPGGTGTRSYMPPEQAVGGDAGRASDVYALGITLHEMLTGEVPRRTLESAGLVVQLTQALPPQIKQVLERATLPERHQRYQTAGALAAAFRAAVHGPSSDALATVPRPSGHTLTNQEKIRELLHDLGRYVESHPDLSEHALISYAFRQHGLFEALGYTPQNRSIFPAQDQAVIMLLMVTDHSMAILEFKRPVFALTEEVARLERDYVRLQPHVVVRCNGRELWIYSRIGTSLIQPPALRLALQEATDSDAEAVLRWLGRPHDANAPHQR